MSSPSCSCRQVYNLPSTASEEGVKEEGDGELEEEMDTDQQSTISWDFFDGINFNPELRDLFVAFEHCESVEFKERLFIRKRLTNKIVGTINISVECTEGDYFSVGLHGCFPIKDRIHVLSLRGFISFNFNIINEVRTEEHMSVLQNSLTSHKLTIGRENKMGLYILRHDFKMDGDTLTNFDYINFNDFLNVVSDSSNVVLMRQMARTDFVGTKVLRFAYTNTCLCDTEYKSYNYELCKVNGGYVNAKRIRLRTIMSNNELTESNAYLSKNGQLLLMTWSGEKYYASLHRKAKIKEGVVPKDADELIPKKERLEDYPILKSVLEEATARNRMLASLYIADHPEVKDILSVISKQLLLHKPHKVVHFVRRCIEPYL